MGTWLAVMLSKPFSCRFFSKMLLRKMPPKPTGSTM
ncbi:Uncharacterised protein [Vibrio cholerae]|nr:Uncharacterised protein [Vibrio cholerae]CSI49455.1 Uncharacterised protein [Vibrio cholerae]